MDVTQLIMMILAPRAHLKQIPLKCVGLLGLWGFRALYLKVLGEAWVQTLARIGAYIALPFSLFYMATSFFTVLGVGILIKSGQLSMNPIEWEAQLAEIQEKQKKGQ